VTKRHTAAAELPRDTFWSAGFSLAEIRDILAAKRGNTIDCAQGAALVASKMAEIQAKITTLQATYGFLDAERAKLEASAIAQGLAIPQLPIHGHTSTP